MRIFQRWARLFYTTSWLYPFYSTFFVVLSTLNWQASPLPLIKLEFRFWEKYAIWSFHIKWNKVLFAKDNFTFIHSSVFIDAELTWNKGTLIYECNQLHIPMYVSWNVSFHSYEIVETMGKIPLWQVTYAHTQLIIGFLSTR